MRSYGPQFGLWRRFLGIPARFEADEPLCGLHGGDQRPDADDVDDPFDVIGKHVQRHLCGDMLQRLHLEVGVPHPEFEGAERVLYRLAALAHLLWMLIEALLNDLEHLFMFPAGNPALFVCGAEMLDCTALADIGPVAAQGQSLFHVCKMMDQALGSPP